MEAKHTPGPWKAKGNDGRYDNRKNSWQVEDESKSCSAAAPITLKSGKVIAFAVDSSKGYSTSFETLDANARLIAAAPDLLAALVEARSFVAMFNGNLTAIDAAIASATGA